MPKLKQIDMERDKVFLEQVLTNKIIKRYNKENINPIGRSYCQLPDNINMKKWDIVRNISNTLTKNAYYVVVGYMDNADFYNNGHKNKDGTKSGYILIRLYNMNIETALVKDFLQSTGVNLLDILNLKNK